MPEEVVKPHLTAFRGVDQAADVAALIAFLEASDKVPSIRAAKAMMLDELKLENAKAALDVGCGFGAEVVDMLGRMPPGGTATGLDGSEIMIAEARRRNADLSLPTTFEVGDAMKLPYPDGSFDACRAETLLQHVTDPQQVVNEMTRVTRSGGRVAVMEFDLGMTLVDHPDRQTTQVILQRLADDAVQPWMGRQLPRLFRQAGLTELSTRPTIVIANQQVIRMLLTRTVDQLGEDNVLAPEQVREWWSQLDQRAAEGPLIAGGGMFVVAATKP